MKIQQIEYSPFPQICSVKSTRFFLNKTERKTLVTACKILEEAEDKLLNYLQPNHSETYTLSDEYEDLADYFHGQYSIYELLNDSWDGLRID